MHDDPFDVPDSEATARLHLRWISTERANDPDVSDRVPRMVRPLLGRAAFDCMCSIGRDHHEDGSPA